MKGKNAQNHSRFRHVLGFAVCIILLLVFVVPVYAADVDSNANTKELSVTVIYAITAICSLLFVVAYFVLIRKKNVWLILLSIAIFVVNFGYYLLASSKTLTEAVCANSIAYFGSVFLSMFMLMIILDLCEIKCHKAIVIVLTAVAFSVFLLASSSSFSELYYKEITLSYENGAAILVKEYGPLHVLYLVYLLGYLGAMISAIVYAMVKKNFRHYKYPLLLAWLVFGNIGIWQIEQVIKWNFEFLSVSYLITEFLLFFICDLQRDFRNAERSAAAPVMGDENREGLLENALPSDIEGLFVEFENRVKTLTPTERTVLQYYIDGNTLEEIAQKSYISINTAKKHNTNLNRKLGISSRDELMLYIELFRRGNRLEEISYNK